MPAESQEQNGLTEVQSLSDHWYYNLRITKPDAYAGGKFCRTYPTVRWPGGLAQWIRYQKPELPF